LARRHLPDEGAFRAYRDDPRLGERAHLREAAVVSTELFVGEDGPDYGGGASPAVTLRDARAEDQAAIRELTLAAYAEYAVRLPQIWAGYGA